MSINSAKSWFAVDRGYKELKKKEMTWYLQSPSRIYFASLKNVRMNLDLLSGNYENIFLMGHFNYDIQNAGLEDFCELFNLKSLINAPICF